MDKKILIKSSLATLVVIIIGIAGYFIWHSSRPDDLKNIVNLSGQRELIEEYRDQLTNLKQRAESTGSALDLQAFGIAQYAIGDIVGAEATYRKQVEKDQNSILGHSGLANALRDQKKFDQAIEEYRKVVQLSPTSIPAYANLASVYQYSLKQQDKAIEVLQLGIANNPGSADLNILLGIAFEQAGNISGAKNAYDKALSLNQNNTTARAALDRLSK